jgi:hypothetical protein
MSNIWYEHWLVGANGVFTATAEGEWTRIGDFDYSVNHVLETETRVLAAVNCGIFSVLRECGTWTQLHDETVTEVLTIAPHSRGAGVAVGCPYGVATGSEDDLGAIRWEFHSDDLTVNERFTSALLPVDGRLDDYIVGTEAGVLCLRTTGWERTNLSGTAVRALIRAHGHYWAGTDEQGIWRSGDGLTWRRVGSGTESRAVFGLASISDGVVAATSEGLLVGDGEGVWVQNGPKIRAACVASHAELDGHWLAGAYPGGLWITEDHGATWCQCGGFSRVMSVTSGRNR